MDPTAAPLAFVVTSEDMMFGDPTWLECRLSGQGNANWLLHTPSEHQEPDSLASALEATYQQHVDPAELTVDGGAVPFGPRTATWRTLARIAVVNTDVPRKTLEEMSVAKEVTASMLGRCLPAQATISKQFDGFRSVAVAVSIHLDRVVTPIRAIAIFSRVHNQGFQLTPYGSDLFARCQKSWPPRPENAIFHIPLAPVAPAVQVELPPMPPHLALPPLSPAVAPTLPAPPTWTATMAAPMQSTQPETMTWIAELNIGSDVSTADFDVSTLLLNVTPTSEQSEPGVEMEHLPEAIVVPPPVMPPQPPAAAPAILSPFDFSNPVDASAAIPARQLSPDGSRQLAQLVEDMAVTMATERSFWNNEPRPSDTPMAQEMPAQSLSPVPDMEWMTAGQELHLPPANRFVYAHLERQMSDIPF
eukprot:jgi/Tetstr1/466456/TSEL_010984.t1